MSNLATTYSYDDFDHAFVRDRIEEFRDQVNRRLSGALTEDQFKPLRLMNGVYLQLHAYMLRVAIPYGVLTARQLRVLAEISERYDRGYGHFTTRQNIQFNWIKLTDVIPALEDLAKVEMHALQTSGNCIRNTTTDPFAAAAKDEIEDPRPWAELIRQWSSLHPEFSFLPRKFKIAITGAHEDRAAIRVHDIGLQITPKGFDVYVGGGQGRTPFVAPLIKKDLPREHLLSYLEAALRVYNRHGRRDNLYKARIKILVSALTPEVYAQEVEAEWQAIDKIKIDAPAAELLRIQSHFNPPALIPNPGAKALLEAKTQADRKLAAFVRSNLRPHKVEGHVSVVISLKPIGGVPGDATGDQMRVVADLAERYGHNEIRVTHEQNLVLPHVSLLDVPALFAALSAHGLGTPNFRQVSDMIACPGLDYCALANARSIPVAEAISNTFADLEESEDIGELQIKISGCINACGHHHVGHIGILGVDKQGEEFYQILIGGRADEKARLGVITGRGLAGPDVAPAIRRVVEEYLRLRDDDTERFIDVVERLGATAFEAAIFAEEIAA